MPMEPPTRSLRSANAALYLYMALGMVAAGAWSLYSGRIHGVWGIVLGIGAPLAALLWAVARLSFCYYSTAQGLTRRYLWRSTHCSWSSLQESSYEEIEAQGIASCQIQLTFSTATFCISSEQFPLEDVQELKQELIDAQILSQNVTSEC